MDNTRTSSFIDQNLKYLLWLVIGIIWSVTAIKWNVLEQHGDAVHYLATIKSIALDHDLDLQNNYTQSSDGHVVVQDGKAYSAHSYGLGFLLSVPYAIKGLKAATIALVFLNALVAFVLALELKRRNVGTLWTVLATGAFCLSNPLWAAAGELYTDLLAGVLVLLFLSLSHRGSRPKGPLEAIIKIGILIVLPWLHIKLALPAALLAAYQLYNNYEQGKLLDFKTINTWIPASVALSGLLLILFNLNHYGHLTGYYAQDAETVAADLNKVSMMLFRWHIDFLAGYLFTHPATWLGILGIGLLWHTERKLAIIWTAIYLTVAILNALHPNYNLNPGLLSGRFGWTLMVLSALPFTFGVDYLSRCFPKFLAAFLMLCLAVQFAAIPLWLETEAKAFMWTEYVTPWQRSLWPLGVPQFVDFTYWKAGAPQIGMVVTFLALVALGFFLNGASTQRARKSLSLMVMLCLCTLVTTAFTYDSIPDHLQTGTAFSIPVGGLPYVQTTSTAAEASETETFAPLISLNGKTLTSNPGLELVLEKTAKDLPGGVYDEKGLFKTCSATDNIVSFGPYAPLAPGKYVLQLTCTTEGQGGSMDIVTDGGAAVCYKQTLLAASEENWVSNFDIPQELKERGFEFRFYAAQPGSLKLYGYKVYRVK